MQKQDVIDQIILNEINLDDIIEPLPSVSSISPDRLEESLTSFQEKYFGETKTTYESGVLPTLLNKLKETLFGGFTTITQTPGLEQKGRSILKSAQTDLEEVKKEWRVFCSSINSRQQYIDSLQTQLDKYTSLYLRLNKKKNQIEQLQEECDEKLISSEDSKIKSLKQSLDHRLELTFMKMNVIGANIEEYHAQHQYLQQENTIYNRILNAAEVNIGKLQLMINCLDLRLKTQGPMSKISSLNLNLHKMEEKITSYQSELHDLLVEHLRVDIPQSHTTSYETQQFSSLKSLHQELYSSDKKEVRKRHNRVMNILSGEHES